ncbi:LOW QUALITY PROTEIN: T-cell surface glycoprotein CD1b-like [Marmota marmota marmota]|uniref:LOW QUALITY PROTEIN: T-cell surface glycoprotein CD1b-like n=1 Tax=Marmota marmota marmota TaxID=9994 RepID=UPI000762AA76|nr:LOW QUALITY PROTEIN: T-cell surface glycoprotein CD1b-like [Marmota marmota marmota]
MRDQTPAGSQRSSGREMLLPLLLLLAVLFSGGDNQEAYQGPTSFHVMQISSFANSTWTLNRGSGWLEDLQIHGWDSDTGTAIFLKPWSKGNLSDEEVTELEEIFRVYFFGITREVQERISDLQLEYPFEFQGIAGCELQSGGAIGSFLKGVIKGLDLLSINTTCWPAPSGGSRAQKVCELIANYKGIFDTIEHLLYKTCPRFLLSVLEAGKVDLQRQVKPKAWLSSGPSPEPGHVLLVCHVSGFYPKPVWVMWIRGEQEQQGTQQGDFLPNADGTWNLRATLDVAAGEAAGLACRVKHSSLGGQDLVLYWGRSIPIGLVILAIIVPTLIFLLGLALWFWRRRSYQDI